MGVSTTRECTCWLATVLSMSSSTPLFAQAPPVCSSNRYGSSTQAAEIEVQMQAGSNADVVAAIRRAQSTRGNELGCAESAYSYGNVNSSAPSVAAIRASWALHRASAAQADALYNRCPALGRGAGAYALGGWSVRGYGFDFDAEPLAAITRNFLATQYSYQRSPGRQPIWAGLYGYAEALGQTGSPCFVRGVVGESLPLACASAPELCVVYQEGAFSGQRFVIGDYLPERAIRDGGAAFDQGWAGVMMVEAAISADSMREQYRQSALLAGEWALAEPPVRNHNYTAKAIWLLAVLYDWTGEARFKAGLIDKLERNLLPGVLMDQDGDGMVDGVSGVRFAELKAPAARQPGRLWDAHNALPWYHAMNGWAMLEAYVAFRSRGDQAWAARLRPYALAMLDNLASELASAGGLAPEGPGLSQIPYLYALALWKLADVEGLHKPDWERALWSVWNTGLASSPGDSKTATAALVHLRAEGVRYRSYQDRELARQSALPVGQRVSGIWYNPARSGEGLFVLALTGSRLFITWFTYDPNDPNKQVWLTIDGSLDGRNFQGQATITRGTRFGQSFDPSAVQRIPWGTVQLDFQNCAKAELRWRSSLSGYGEGNQSLVQLNDLEGLDCAP